MANAQTLKIEILSPPDNAKVSNHALVEGVVSGAKNTDAVWVVVHPMEITDSWVQPKISVRKDGKWSVKAYFGRPGSEDVNKQFEVEAFVNPRRPKCADAAENSKPFKEGDVLCDWPDADAKSNVVQVTRQ